MSDGCQCSRQRPGEGCENGITQEDLLCDTCRAGCNAVRGIDVKPTRHLRLDMKSLRITLK